MLYTDRSPGLEVKGPYNHGVQPCLDWPCAHGAGLQRNHHCTSFQPPTAQPSACAPLARSRHGLSHPEGLVGCELLKVPCPPHNYSPTGTSPLANAVRASSRASSIYLLYMAFRPLGGKLVRMEGFEPPAYGLGNRRSILLSYMRKLIQ